MAPRDHGDPAGTEGEVGGEVGVARKMPDFPFERLARNAIAPDSFIFTSCFGNELNVTPGTVGTSSPSRTTKKLLPATLTKTPSPLVTPSKNDPANATRHLSSDAPIACATVAPGNPLDP